MATSEYIVNVDEETFEEVVVKSDVPVLVDFWAPWCGPCHMVAPVIEELAREHFDRVKFVKVDVDKAQKIASSMGISGIPTIVLFNQGEAVDRQVGAQSKAALEKMIQELLKRGG